jgi:hypothetical protein
MTDTFVYWKGQSQINGENILLLLTGISRPSQNRKTGPVIQSYILKEGIKPTEYRHQGAKAICGECPIKDACYVGNYYLNSIYDGSNREVDHFPLALLKGRVLRLGAYGDPAAVPFAVWDRLVKWTAGWTGYTHQWQYCDQNFKKLTMASVETVTQAEQAWSMGWQTYRVGLPSEEPTTDELYCPHYTFEFNPPIKCLQCQLCAGINSDLSPKKGIFVHVHGSHGKKKRYQEIRSNENDILKNLQLGI